jgi:hypothetical protein
VAIRFPGVDSDNPRLPDNVIAATDGVVVPHGFTKADVVAALDAAEAIGHGTIVRFLPGIYELDTGLSLSGYHAQLQGCGAAGTLAAPTGTVFRASTQTGPVLDFGGWLPPDSFHGRVTHGGFWVQGSNAADATKVRAGVRLVQMSSATFHDISVGRTGGPCWLHDGPSAAVYLCDFERIICTTPVSAAANDVPYVKMIGSNGNRFRGWGLRSVTSGADTGASGAVILVDDGTFAPHDNLFDAWWIEFLHLPTNATVFALAGHRNTISNLQPFDCTKVSGATGTSYIRLTAPAVSDFGGNLITGIIPGKGTGATNIDCGVDIRQNRNSVRGIKGYRGTNVIIASGVTNTDVDLGGAEAAATDPAVVDSSASATQRYHDAYLRTERVGPYVLDERTAGNGGAGLRVQDPATPANGAFWMGTSGPRVQAVGTQMYYTADVINYRNIALNAAPIVVLGTGSAPRILTGTGTPESSQTAVVGSIYLRTDGGANTTLYVKESGSSSTGWVAK